jgi:hypothetical protein
MGDLRAVSGEPPEANGGIAGPDRACRVLYGPREYSCPGGRVALFLIDALVQLDLG